MANNCLSELNLEEWSKLRDLFIKNWPEHILAYSTITNYIRLNNQHLAPNSKLFCVNNGENGTFILQERAITCVYTLQESCDELKKALTEFNWKNEIKIHPYNIKHKESINLVFNKLNLDVIYDNETTMLWLPKERALNFEINIPGDVYIAQLKPEHSALANDHWRHKHPGSDIYLKSLVVNNLSCGVFGKDDNELRAWVLRLNNGILTALQTKVEHIRKGYGSLLIKSMSQMIAKQGEDTIACVIEPPRGDLIAKNMFQKLGFQVVGSMWWAKTNAIK